MPVRAVRGDLVGARPRVEREQRPAAVGPQRLVPGERHVCADALVELDEERVLHLVAQGQGLDRDAGGDRFLGRLVGQKSERPRAIFAVLDPVGDDPGEAGQGVEVAG